MRNVGRIIATALMTLGLGAVLAGSAAAKPAVLNLYYTSGETEVSVTAGQQIEGYDTNWIFESAEGTVQCSTEETTSGTLGLAETNNEKTDKFSVTSTIDGFFATTGCTSTVPLLTASAEGFWFNANSFGSNVEGHFKLSAKGKAEYATAAAKDTAIEVRQSGDAGTRCYYEVTKLKGTLAPLPGPVALEFTKQKLKLLKIINSSAACPKKATVSTVVYPYVLLGESGEAELYGKLT